MGVGEFLRSPGPRRWVSAVLASSYKHREMVSEVKELLKTTKVWPRKVSCGETFLRTSECGRGGERVPKKRQKLVWEAGEFPKPSKCGLGRPAVVRCS